MSERKKERYNERKKRYEEKKKAWKEKRKKRKEGYEKGREEWGLKSPGSTESWNPPEPKSGGREVEKVEPESTPEQKQLVDVFDEGENILITAQLSDVPLPEDSTINEVKELTFKHGTLEIRLGKQEEELSEEEKGALEEEEETTAKIKEKILWKLKSEGKKENTRLHKRKG